MVLLGEHFRSDESSRHSEWLRQRRWFIKGRQDQERRADVAEKLEDDLVGLATEAVMASEAQIKAFEAKLDHYDEATVHALMENQELLDAVTERIADMLARAYRMEDGRRVFKTEDGTQVFDEFGQEVGPDELDPNLIDEKRPTWEAFSEAKTLEQELFAERADIIELQEKLDAARDDIAEGGISAADLDQLDADLLDAMPPTVRAHAGLEPREPALDLKTAFKVPTAIPTVETQSVEVSTPAPGPFQ